MVPLDCPERNQLQCYLMPPDVNAPGGFIHPDVGIEPIRCRPDNASPTADDNVSIPSTHRTPSWSTQPVWSLITAARIDLTSASGQFRQLWRSASLLSRQRSCAASSAW